MGGRTGEMTARRPGRASCRSPVSTAALTRIGIRFSNVSPKLPSAYVRPDTQETGRCPDFCPSWGQDIARRPESQAATVDGWQGAEPGPNRGGNRGRTKGPTHDRTHGCTGGRTSGRTNGLTDGPTDGPTHGPISGPVDVGLGVGLDVSVDDVHRGFVHRSVHGRRNPALHGRRHGIAHGTAHLGLDLGLHGIHHGILQAGGDHLPHDVGAVPAAAPRAVLGAGGVSP